MKPLQHFKTITHHKILVMKNCFRMGLYWQGLTHDLSKYMPSEFLVGAKYYQGDRSPNNAEREDIGYSSAWLHHKGRNKHHFEYWLDYSAAEGIGIVPAEMPLRFVVEMFADRVAASKIYNGKNYTDDMPLNYYQKGKSHIMIHENSGRILEEMLHMLARDGEKKTFAYIKKNYVKKMKHGTSGRTEHIIE